MAQITEDPYEVLGVHREATHIEIKAAYRKAARDSHPDANPDDPHAEARFKSVAVAYEILSDPEKRKLLATKSGLSLSTIAAVTQGHAHLSSQDIKRLRDVCVSI